MVHLRARDYAPGTGRFTTTDPLDGVAGEVTVANPYPYAANEPLNMVDPLGLRPLSDSDLRTDDLRFGHQPCASMGGTTSPGTTIPCQSMLGAREKGMLGLKPLIDKYARMNGIDPFLLATIIHHEGGNYLDTKRRPATQLAESCLPGIGAIKCPATVGIANVNPNTAVMVLNEVYGMDVGAGDARDYLINSDEFSIAVAAGYLGLLSREYGIIDNRSLFLAYAASPQTIEALGAVDFDVRRLARESATSLYVTGQPDPRYGVSAGTIDALLRREGYWDSSSRKVAEAGF